MHYPDEYSKTHVGTAVQASLAYAAIQILVYSGHRGWESSLWYSLHSLHARYGYVPCQQGISQSSQGGGAVFTLQLF